MACMMLLHWLLALSFLSSVRSSDIGCKLLRTSTKLGFHREVTTDLILTNLPEIAYPDSCDIALVENIPTGMYADLYQLKAAEEFGAPKTYSPVDMDIEQPEYLSPPHTLYVFGDLIHDATSRDFHWSVTVPVHLRYHRPRLGGNTAEVSLGPPAVLVRCSDNRKAEGIGKVVTAPCHQEPIQECRWRQIECQGDHLYFQVPVGRKEHQDIVVWGTLTVTVGATLYLCYVILRQDWSNNVKKVEVGKKDR